MADSLSFNYSDVFLSFHFDEDQTCSHMVKNHTLVYIYSGELELHNGDEIMNIRTGECAFLRKNHKVNFTRKSRGDEQFRAIFLEFSRAFLRDYYRNMDKSLLPTGIKDCDINIVRVKQTPDIKSLFMSITPYFESGEKPTKELIDLKLREGIHAILNINNKTAVTLFDFIEPWKIDLKEFMEENYMHNLSLEEIASFTGRSLATFKRDFKKISDISPQKWIITRRLDEANRLIKDEKKAVSDVYVNVGFKSLSHFSQAYKRQFGQAPTK
ncbi:MAG: helix-turn-helix transcriptional regulator [Bacteroidales bacterium]